MKKIILLLLVIPFLYSCSSKSVPTVVATQIQPASPLDGQWQGTGSTSDGKPFKVFLSIQNSALTGLIYTFIGSNGNPCTAIAYGQIPPASQPKIINNALESKLGDDLTISASFQSDSESSDLLAGSSVSL